MAIVSPRRLSFLCALAALLLLGAGDLGQAAPKRVASDQPELDLYPSTTVPGRTAGTMEFDLYMPSSTEMAKVVLFVPTGYPPNGITGRVIGTGAGLVAAWDPNFLPSLGRIVAADPAAYTTNTCAPGLHQAVWLLTLENLPPTPILIDATTGADTSLGGYKLQFCLPPSSSGTMKIHELDFLVGKLMNPPTSGAYMWRAFVTPYVGGVPSDPATFELRGTIPMPMHLTLRGVYDRKHKRAILTGRLTAAGLSVTGAYLDLYVKRSGGFRYVATTRVKAGGKFRVVRRVKATTRFRIVTATWYDCDPGSPAPAGCISDTLANITSPVVKVVVRKR